jgi:hypothetical protein
MNHDDDNMGDEAAQVPPSPVQPRRWRLKQEVSTGDLLIAASMIAGMFLWGSKIESRLAVVEAQQTMQRIIDSAQDQTLRESMARIEISLRTIQEHLLSTTRSGGMR